MLNIQNGIAVITLDNPPVNGLGHALRERIVRQLEAAHAEPAVRGIVLTGSDRAFSAGADVHEFATPLQFQEPILRSVLTAVEASAKPVVAALAGVALGGGLELALACHGHVALESARVGLPEVTLGLIPGSGGTQRLPRLIGPEAALALILTGLPKSAKELAASGLFDAVVTDDLVPAAVRRALELAEAGVSLPRARDNQPEAAQVPAIVEALRAKLQTRQRLQPAYAAALDTVAACALPFDQGMQRERGLFLELLPSKAAQALRYQFKAEREATRLPAGLDAAPRQVDRVAVIGAGTMGSGWQMACLVRMATPSFGAPSRETYSPRSATSRCAWLTTRTFAPRCDASAVIAAQGAPRSACSANFANCIAGRCRASLGEHSLPMAALPNLSRRDRSSMTTMKTESATGCCQTPRSANSTRSRSGCEAPMNRFPPVIGMGVSVR